MNTFQASDGENVIVLVSVGLALPWQLHCLRMANFETKSNLT